MNKKDVVVIGGGIIGLACAYYLSKDGANVTVLDKGPKEQASSHGNCGLISPSHIMPLNSIGLILKSFGMMLKKDAAFKIRPQADWTFIRWLFGFMAKSLPSSIHHSTVGRMQLLLSSASLYKKVIEDENISCNWSEDGILFVFKSKKGFDDYKSTDDYTKKFGINAEPIIGERLISLEPALQDNVYGAWLYEIDNWLKPDEMVKAFSKKIEENGGRILHESEVVDFGMTQGKIQSVVDKSGSVHEAKDFILATGAWSPLLSKKLGFSLPIIPGKGYSITMKSPKIAPKRPCILMEKKVVATPWEGTYRLGSTMELAGYDESMNQVRLQALKEGATSYLKEPYSEEVLEEWWGWRPMTFDGLPVIDKSPKQKNLWLACGHSMLGMSMATGTGKLISELISGKDPHMDISSYAISRF